VQGVQQAGGERVPGAHGVHCGHAHRGYGDLDRAAPAEGSVGPAGAIREPSGAQVTGCGSVSSPTNRPSSPWLRDASICHRPSRSWMIRALYQVSSVSGRALATYGRSSEPADTAQDPPVSSPAAPVPGELRPQAGEQQHRLTVHYLDLWYLEVPEAGTRWGQRWPDRPVHQVVGVRVPDHTPVVDPSSTAPSLTSDSHNSQPPPVSASAAQ
jgi:hypothetical protein